MHVLHFDAGLCINPGMSQRGGRGGGRPPRFLAPPLTARFSDLETCLKSIHSKINNKTPGPVAISLKKLRLVYFDLVDIEQLSISILAS